MDSKQDIAKEMTYNLKRQFCTKTTISQLKGFNPMIIGSWGAKDFTNIEDRCLLFEVNARYFSGWISIVLDWMDLYEVRLHSFRDQKYDVVLAGVYCDKLTTSIDELIEQVN